jgi:hypothetical protein
MTPPDKAKVYFPRNKAGVLPDPASDPLVTICLNEQWLPVLQGQLHHLRWRGILWDGTKEEIDQTHDYVEKLLDMLMGRDCALITDLRIQSGRLEAQYDCSEDWVLIGKVMTGGIRYQNGAVQYDMDGDGTFEVTQYINSEQNIYGEGIPITSDEDRFCRAAWMLARSLCSNFADLHSLYRIGYNVTTSIAQSIIELSPLTAYFDDTVEYIFETMPQALFDYVITSARDEDTIKLVANLLYCSIVDHYPNDMDDVIEDIPTGDLAPVFEASTSNISWVNFEALSEKIYLAGQNKLVAYMVINNANLAVSQLREKMGMGTPTEKVMKKALASAVWIDGRDCEDFGCNTWEHEFNFYNNSNGWTRYPESATINQPAGTWVTAEGWRSENKQGAQRLRINKLMPSGANLHITSAELQFTPNMASGDFFITVQFDYKAIDTTPDNPRTALISIGSPPASSPQEWAGDIDSVPSARMMITLAYATSKPVTVPRLILRGIGVNPFL